MSDKKKGIFLIIALFGVMSVSVFGTETPTKLVTLDYYGKVTEYETKANTLEDFLDSEEIQLAKTDEINTNLDTILEEENNISIKKGIEVTLVINGENSTYSTVEGTTIGNVVGTLIKDTDVQHVYDGSYGTELVDGEVYELKTRYEDIVKQNEIMPYKIEYFEVETLEPGQEEIVVYGLDGAKEIITTKSMFGTEVLEEVIDENILVEPINQIVNVGAKNKISTEKGDLVYSSVLTMNGSAYTAGFESTGKNPGDAGYGRTATGMSATKGVVAVDPDVIPLGTELYISGYGLAVAGDTGGAIKGNKIDLCYDTLNEALNFGRRNVSVYILE